jgi:hypothetical protein
VKKTITLDDIKNARKSIDAPPSPIYVFSDKIKDPNHPLHRIVQTYVDAGLAVYSPDVSIEACYSQIKK